MTDLENYCENIDASVFSVDLLFDDDRRNMLKHYITRWSNAIKNHETQEPDEPTCPSCGGPMYTQAHWHYWQCDDCGRWDDKEEMEP